MLGDGYIMKYNRSYYVCLKVKDYEFAKRFCKELFTYKSIKPKIRKEYWESSRQGFIYQIKFSNKQLYSLIIALKDNFFNEISTSSDDIKIYFLEGLYDSEGCITDKRFSNRIIMNNRNYEIIELSKILLKDIGIESHISQTTNQNKPYYELYVCSPNEILKFYNIIRFSISRKQKRLIKLISRDNRKYDIWNEKDTKKLILLRDNKFKLKDIAIQLRRNLYSIKNKVKILNRSSSEYSN